MVSGGLGSGADSHSSSSERSTAGNPRPYLAPPAGLNNYSKESKRIANSPPHQPRDVDRKPGADNSGASSSKRNAQKEKKEKVAPPVFV